jgi:tRNA pseudouridine55 synthase
MNINGLVLLDKPPGYTSRQLTSIVSRLFRQKKAGHLGTLDPMATGLLPVLIGQATRLAPFLESGVKEYWAVIKLGQETDTMDSEGRLISESPVPSLKKEQLFAILDKFQGEIEQRPPMYSAVKHQGRRLYELARKGESVETKPRKVTIFAITLKNFNEKIIELVVRCSPGTYLRVLASELGKTIGCGAHLAGLRRLKSGRFQVEQAVELSKLTPENCMQYLVPLEEILDFDTVRVGDEDGYRIRDGNTIPLKNISAGQKVFGSLIQLISGPAFAICEIIEKDGQPFLKPVRVFPSEGK